MNDNIDTNANPDGGDVTGSEAAWLSSVPENLRSNEAFKGIESASDVYQQFVDMKGNAENMIQIPGDGATDEDRAAFMNKLGRPDTADKYTMAKPENLPDGVDYDDTISETFKGIFHEIGLSDSQASTIWEKYHDIAVQGFEATQKAEKEAYDTAVNALKDEWKGDKFKENTELAHRAFSGIFSDETKQAEAKAFLEETKVNGLSIGNHPMFLKIFQQIGSVMSDDTLNHGRSGGPGGETSEEEIAKKRFPNTKF